MKQIIQHDFPSLKGVYLVGGCVRDLLLDRSPTDFDLAVLEDPEGAAKTISSHIHGHLIQLGKPEFALYRILSDHGVIDVQGVNGMSIEEDLAQRDFTINAMACPIDSDRIIDIHGGRTDLKKKIVRMTSETAFTSDPIRLLRAYRMAAVLKFHIEPFTKAAIKQHSRKIKISAGERIREELFQLFKVAHAHGYVMEMAESDLLFAIFPELSDLNGCIQNRFHAGDVLVHTLSTLKHMEYILMHMDVLLPNLFLHLENSIGDHSRVLLKFSTLLHDIGKPKSKSMDNERNRHFYGHEKIGVHITASVFKRLKLSKPDALFIEHMVRHHLLPLHLYQSAKEKRLSQKGKARFFMKNGRMAPAVLLHALADQMAKQKKEDHSFLKFIRNMLEEFFFNFKPVSRRPKLLTGHDLMREFGLSPSPLFSEILNHVEEKRLAGEITTKAEARAAVQQYLESGGPGSDT